MSAAVSESIGKLLLEGYKMLADSCEVCYTVLMQDRRGKIVCVKCDSAPKTQPGHGQGDMNGVISKGELLSNGDVHGDTSQPILSEASVSALSVSEEVLAAEMKMAALSLKRLSQQGHDLQGKLLYIKYIREVAETLSSLKALQKP